MPRNCTVERFLVPPSQVPHVTREGDRDAAAADQQQGRHGEAVAAELGREIRKVSSVH